ncbi:MAG: PilC/PilY family type IV pilus protein [Gammaproteobacteria bacterium]|nr:MAG: PilC/PilY family type IV pilus protein [Gammaproteobacteria bacterium]
MNKLISTFNKTGRMVAIAVIGFSAGISNPGTAWSANILVLPKVPLFVNINAVPNIFIEMDDSGSMDWTVLAPRHFTACRYDANLDCDTIEPTGSGLIYDYTGEDDDFANFEYVDSASDDAYNTGCNSGRNVFELCTNRNPDDFDWRARSAALNVIFFNPAANYKPWPGYTPASFGSARSYPDPALAGYTDTRDLSGFVYNYWIDDKGFSGTQPDRTDVLNGANGLVDEWDSHIKVTVDSAGATCEWVTYAPNAAGLNRTTTTLPPSDPGCLAATGSASASALAQNIANWYQYYRRRTMVARAGVATVINDIPGFRYGFGMINDQNLFVEMPPASTTVYTAHNNALVDSFIEYQQQPRGTPLRRGLERIGDYYAGDLSGKVSPIVEACQKNFTVLFTDGFWNGGNPYNVTSDVDGDGAVISNRSVTLADVAKHYYDTDLSSSFPNVVPTDPFDAANWQHMVTFTIGFGVTGDLRDTDGDGWPNPALTSSDLWYTPSSGDNEKRVDDLWHAAFNSKGKYVSAKRPEDLITGLRDAIFNISDRIGSAASGSANGGSISSSSKIFQAKFDASDWHGELLALNVDPTTGALGNVEWEAGGLLNLRSAASRNIFTFNGSSGSNFSWTALNGSQQAALGINPQSGLADGRGQDRLLYIRGDDSNEGPTSSDFRPRSFKLGDLTHSDPVFVGGPPFFYPFNAYSSFAAANRTRQAAVYVGGNDGMLHGFAEDTGEELFAYVPNYVIPKLNQLTDPSYGHEFFVDGSPTYGDAYINSAWKSVLVASLRGGGQAVYALDITNPAGFSAANVLWEFTDADDSDLGYYYGSPQIKKMQNGKWAAIFTSGYNNTEADTYQSATGAAYVYVVYIEDGSYVKIPVPGADGLAEPAVADVDGDAKADFIYVGDLNGKLWKIDVTSSSSGSWAVAFSGAPLFTATTSGGIPQSITTRPAIKRHPMGISNGVLVLFGTGRYLELADDTATGVPTQSVYSIWDRDGYYNGTVVPAARNNYGANGFNRSTQLQNQTILVDSGSGSRIIDATASSLPIWFNADGSPKDRGWVIDLPETGERVNRRIVLRDDLAFFVTLIPQDDVCSAGGRGWLMAIDSTTGTAPRFPVFDIDGNNIVNIDDTLLVGTSTGGNGEPDPTNPIGLGSLSIPNLPAFLFDDRPVDLSGSVVSVFPPSPNTSRGCGSSGARAYTYTTQTNGSVTMVTTAAQPLSCGRQSWKQSK